MDRPLCADRLGRAVALLALVVGLLAMHGLAGTHHAAAAVPTDPDASHPTSAHAASGHVAVPTEHGATHGYDEGSGHHALAGAGVPVALTAAGVPGCGDDCEPGVATLCVAVLAVTAIAVAAWRDARSRTGTSQTTRRSPARAPVVLRLPPRLDPVAELCVSRT